MGNQMSELNGQDTADTLTIEENVHVGCSVVFSYRYDAGKIMVTACRSQPEKTAR